MPAEPGEAYSIIAIRQGKTVACSAGELAKQAFLFHGKSDNSFAASARPGHEEWSQAAEQEDNRKLEFCGDLAPKTREAGKAN
jgi:hypothetical protein